MNKRYVKNWSAKGMNEHKKYNDPIIFLTLLLNIT